MGAAIFLVLLAIYSAGYAGHVYSADDISSLSVGWSIAYQGDFEARLDAWTARFPDQSNTFGPAGEVYSKKGPLLAFLAAFVYRITSGAGLPVTPLITTLNLGVTAVAGWLLFNLSRQAGFGPRQAAASALAWGLLTPALAYSRFFFTEPLAALGLVAACLSALRFSGWAGSFGAGLGLSFAALARPAALALVPAILPLVAPRLWASGRLLGFSLGLLPGILGLGLYNAVRFGNPLVAGLSPVETFSTPPWVGIPGLLWSPGRGLLFFAPAALIGLAGLPFAWKVHRRLAVTSALMVLGHLVLYGTWYGWHGGHAWGPRFLVPALPFLALGSGPLLGGWAERGLVFKAITVTLPGLSLIVQAAGFLTDFNRAPQPRGSTDPLLWELPSPAWTVPLELLLRGQLDPVWARHGLWPVPVLLGGAATLALVAGLRNFRGRLLVGLVGLALTLAALGYQIGVAASETAPHELGLAEALSALQNQVRPQDAVILAAPYVQTWLLDHYRLPNPTLGLTEDSLRLEPRFRLTLSRLLKPGGQLWLLVQGFAFPDPAAELDAELHRELCWTGPINSFGGVRITRFLVPGNFQNLGVQAAFGQSLRLRASAWDGTGVLAPGDAFCVRLEWETGGPDGPANAYVSVQVLDATGKLIAQHDGPPGAGFDQPGPTVIDNHGLLLPDHLTDGTFYLTVVVYNPATFERHHLEAGRDRLTLAAFRIKGPAR